MGDSVSDLSTWTPQQIGEMPQESAQAFINEDARKNLIKALMTAALLGAGGRGVIGIMGNIRRNMQRKREREKAMEPKHELTIATKAAAYPDWYPAALALGVPGALAGGWMGTDRIMKRYRQTRSRQELEKAKEEFEDALAEEQQLKFSADLSALAEAWSEGKLNEDTLEKAARSLLDAGWKTYLTLAALMTLAGGGIGWKLIGDNPEAMRIKAHREAMRRQRAVRPISLVARSKAISHIPQDEEREQDTNKMARVKSARSLLPHLKSLPGTAMKAGLGALGASWLGTKTRAGRNWMASRSEDLMRDPAFVQRQTQLMLQNPRIMQQVYRQMMPTITAQMVQQRPVMGRLMAYLMGTHQMPRPVLSPQYYG